MQKVLQGRKLRRSCVSIKTRSQKESSAQSRRISRYGLAQENASCWMGNCICVHLRTDHAAGSKPNCSTSLKLGGGLAMIRRTVELSIVGYVLIWFGYKMFNFAEERVELRYDHKNKISNRTHSSLVWGSVAIGAVGATCWLLATIPLIASVMRKFLCRR